MRLRIRPVLRMRFAKDKCSKIAYQIIQIIALSFQRFPLGSPRAGRKGDCFFCPFSRPGGQRKENNAVGNRDFLGHRVGHQAGKAGGLGFDQRNRKALVDRRKQKNKLN